MPENQPTSLSIDIQNPQDYSEIPSEKQFKTWLESALKVAPSNLENPEITLRIVSSEESQALNSSYRNKETPTNVLSFPFEHPESLPADAFENLLGDLVICKEVLETEALEQNKELHNHWAHLVIHGFLHLLGFDHQFDKEAEEMEQIEIKILATLGIQDPYL